MALQVREGVNSRERSSTPSNPPAGKRLLYPKSDGWYELSSAGVETKVSNVTGGAGDMVLASDQVITGVKRFRPSTLLMTNADGSVTAEPYSDLNPPQSFEMTVAVEPPSPTAGEAVLFTTDGASLRMKSTAGTVTVIGPSAGGGAGITTRAVTSAVSAVANEVVLANATTAAFAVTLPAHASGTQVWVKKTDASVNIVTATPTSGTIDGLATYPLNVRYAALHLVSDGTNWHIL